MAIQTNVAGATLVQIQRPNSEGVLTGTIYNLGYTRNGVDIVEQPAFYPVKSDQRGGDEGPAVEMQLLDMTHIIRLRLSQYDPVVAAMLETIASNGTLGSVVARGTLLMTANFVRVLLNNTTDDRNYPFCIVNESIEVNKGTKYSELAVDLCAYSNLSSNVLYNTTMV